MDQDQVFRAPIFHGVKMAAFAVAATFILLALLTLFGITVRYSVGIMIGVAVVMIIMQPTYIVTSDALVIKTGFLKKTLSFAKVTFKIERLQGAEALVTSFTLDAIRLKISSGPVKSQVLLLPDQQRDDLIQAMREKGARFA